MWSLRIFLLLAILLSVTKLKGAEDLYMLLQRLNNKSERNATIQTILERNARNNYIYYDDNSVASQTDTTYRYALARLILAQAFHNQGDYTTSSQLCGGVINYFYDRQATSYTFSSLILQSTNFIQLGLIEDALPLIIKSQTLATSIHNPLLTIRALSHMGKVYLSAAKPEASLVYIIEGIDRCRSYSSPESERLLIELLCQQCEALLFLQRADTCLAPLEEAISICNTHPSWGMLSKTRRLQGDVYFALQRFPRAEQAYLEALYYSQTEINPTQRVYILRQLGELRALQKLTSSALVYNQQALHLADSLQLGELSRSLLWQRYRFTRTENPAEALRNLELYNKLGDSLSNTALSTKLSVLHTRYERELSKKQIELQELQIVRDGYAKVILTSFIFLLFIITGVLLILAYHRKRRLHYMEEVNLSKNRFFSIISHDAKNHAIAIQMVLGQILQYYPTFSEIQLKELLVQTKAAADMQIEFLVNLLNWARLQLDAIPYLPQEFDVIELIEKNKRFFALHLANKKIDLKLITPAKCMLWADRDMVDVILRNLLSNAIKFSHPGGNIEITVLKSKRHIELRIQDHGIGMTSEQISKLGRIEQRMMNIGTRGEKGSGLGLILCHAMAHTNGADLKVSSKPGEGTCIVLDFQRTKS